MQKKKNISTKKQLEHVIDNGGPRKLREVLPDGYPERAPGPTYNLIEDAIKKKKVEMAAIFFEHGANPQGPVSKEDPAFANLVMGQTKQVIEQALEYCPKIFPKENLTGYAVDALESNNLELAVGFLVEYIKQNGSTNNWANPNWYDNIRRIITEYEDKPFTLFRRLDDETDTFLEQVEHDDRSYKLTQYFLRHQPAPGLKGYVNSGPLSINSNTWGSAIKQSDAPHACVRRFLEYQKQSEDEFDDKELFDKAASVLINDASMNAKILYKELEKVYDGHIPASVISHINPLEENGEAWTNVVFPGVKNDNNPHIYRKKIEALNVFTSTFLNAYDDQTRKAPDDDKPKRARQFYNVLFEYDYTIMVNELDFETIMRQLGNINKTESEFLERFVSNIEIEPNESISADYDQDTYAPNTYWKKKLVFNMAKTTQNYNLLEVVIEGSIRQHETDIVKTVIDNTEVDRQDWLGRTVIDQGIKTALSYRHDEVLPDLVDKYPADIGLTYALDENWEPVLLKQIDDSDCFDTDNIDDTETRITLYKKALETTNYPAYVRFLHDELNLEYSDIIEPLYQNVNGEAKTWLLNQVDQATRSALTI